MMKMQKKDVKSKRKFRKEKLRLNLHNWSERDVIAYYRDNV